MIGIWASKKKDMLYVIHRNLQKEAKIYLDGALVLTILPDVKLVVLRVLFNKFDAISSLPGEVLEEGGNWVVNITGALDLDGDPETFDSSFLGMDEIELKR